MPAKSPTSTAYQSATHLESWDLAPPAKPIFDHVFYPAFTKGMGARAATLSSTIESDLGYLIRSEDQQSRLQSANLLRSAIAKQIADAVAAASKNPASTEQSTVLTELSPYERYLRDYELYVERLTSLKTTLHEKKVAERFLNKKFKQGVASADTPSVEAGVEFRQSAAEKELLANPHAHMAWHPRAKAQPRVAKHPELKAAKAEIKKAVVAAKVTRAKAKAATIPQVTAARVGAQQAKQSVKSAELAQKLRFKQAVLSEKKANTEEAAHLTAARQLAATKKGLESVESRRASTFKKHGKAVTFPLPKEGEFLKPVVVENVPEQTGNSWTEVRRAKRSFADVASGSADPTQAKLVFNSTPITTVVTAAGPTAGTS